jgi:hypothetical protein
VTLIMASLLIAAALFFVAPMIRRLLQGESPVELPKAIVKVKPEDVAAPAEGPL